MKQLSLEMGLEMLAKCFDVWYNESVGAVGEDH